jgi:hypothetical protein
LTSDGRNAYLTWLFRPTGVFIMRTREFITLVGGAAVSWPRFARAQQPSNVVPRVGILLQNSEGELEVQTRNAAFREALNKLARGRPLSRINQ